LLKFYRELGIEDRLGTEGIGEEEAIQRLADLDTNKDRYVCGGGEATFSGGKSDDTANKHAD
jgi:hypothetical protein